MSNQALNGTEVMCKPSPSVTLFTAFNLASEPTNGPCSSRKRLAEIMSEPALVAFLMKKAQENSHSANSLSIDTWRQVVTAKLQDGPQDTISLYALVSEEGYKISYKAFRGLIRELNEDGSFEISVRNRQGRARMPLTVLSLPK